MIAGNMKQLPVLGSCFLYAIYLVFRGDGQVDDL